ncbi:unnamed protein product [Linum trigynum]|uniref:Uncharacterized protein n=1 Tax=Linum trigynum TaxID=586398 RepID=A0AAV2E029_9ROSI
MRWLSVMATQIAPTPRSAVVMPTEKKANRSGVRLGAFSNPRGEAGPGDGGGVGLVAVPPERLRIIEEGGRRPMP